jgi:hypothetical protein
VSPDDLLERVTGGRLGELAPLLDLLGAEELSALLLEGRDRLHREIGRLSKGAGKVLRYLEELDTTDLASVVERLTGSQRLTRILEFLDEAPASPEELRERLLQEADQRLRRVVERLLGRALDSLNKQDLAKRLARPRSWA